MVRAFLFYLNEVVKQAALFILLLIAFCFSVSSQPDVTTREEIADSTRTDSLLLDARVKTLHAGLRPFDDTLHMAEEQPSYLRSVNYISYRYQNIDPHPELRRNKFPFFVDSISRTDSTLIVALYGVYSGGYYPTGTACLRNDTLMLIHWEESSSAPPLGAYFKWTLLFEVNLDSSASLPVIVITDRYACARRREAFIHEQGFSLLKNVLEDFSTPLAKERRYNPHLHNSLLGDALPDSYRTFADTTSLITDKNPKLLAFEYSFPPFTEEECENKSYRYSSPFRIIRKEYDGDVLTLTISGNQGSRYKMDANIFISGDTIFLIQWPSAPEEDWALAIFKQQLTYTMRVPQKPWNFAVVDLFLYVHNHKEWFKEQREHSPE